MNWKSLVIVTGLAIAASATTASAQTYPSRPVRIVMGVAPGTTSDIVVRVFATQLSSRLGQPVLLENRPGANLSIAARAVVNAEPDGYALFAGNVTLFHPVFMKNQPIDAGKDLAPVSLLSSTEFGFLSSAAIVGVGGKPVTSWAEFIGWAKANPGKLNFGSVGPPFDLIMNMVKQKTGISYISVPYTGGALIIPSMVAGDIHLTVSSIPVFVPNLNAGSIRALMVTTKSALLPQTPIAADLGFPEFESIRFNLGLWAPAKTPKDIISRVATETAAVAKLPNVAEQFRKVFGSDPIGSTPEEEERLFQAEMKTWIEAARLANFQPQ